MKIGFDLISDLNLTTADKFDWEGKATSLYCIVAGNVSSDIRVIAMALTSLSRCYQGVFYIAGSLEFSEVESINRRITDLSKLCNKIRNVAFLHHNVVIIDGVAIIGANGWNGNTKVLANADESKLEILRYDDLLYLKNSIEKLQKHLDVKKILIATNSVPHTGLYFKEIPEEVKGNPELTISLIADSEKKVSHWAFGTHEKIVDATFNSINYFNNPSLKTASPYWAKRFDIEV